MREKLPSFESLLRDPKAREKLTDLQLYNFVQDVRRMAQGLGRPDRAGPDPASFAVQLSHGEWHQADHLRLLSSYLAKLQRRELRYLAVSMPPRHGKSLLVDVYFPLWWLTKDPRSRIILAGYGETFARLWGAQVRDKLIEHAEETNVLISKDQTAADDWSTSLGGGMVSVGVGGSLVGRGADLLIIDDPIKNDQEAYSQVYRDRMWNWWQASAFTRLQPNGVVVIVCCLTGDTPILRPDGTETSIQDIRPGDRVVSYDNGRLTTATVTNWATQGLDSIFTIKTRSGRVRANARHPFLVERSGGAEWVRTASLIRGDRILRVTGASGGGFAAPPRDADGLLIARDSASPTTTRTDGRGAFARRLPTLVNSVKHTFAIATASILPTTTAYFKSRGMCVLCAENPLLQPISVGVDICSLITATRRSESGGSSATTATSWLATDEPSSGSNERLSTYAVTGDPVESVTLSGVEEVFDIQVDPTGNFIASGLVTHNTRWHEDDLLGRLEKENKEGRWTFLNIPALAEANDPLGRPLGAPLWPEQWKDDDPDYRVRQSSISPYWWSAQFQGRPVPEGGGVIPRDSFRFYSPSEFPESPDQWIQSWDPALKDTTSSDYWVGQVWARKGANLYLVDSSRGHYNLAQASGIIRSWTLKYPKALAKIMEATAMGPAVKQILSHEIPGIVPWPPKGQVLGTKRSRVEAIVPALLSGNIYLPQRKDGTKDRWVWEFVEECAAFDKGAHDDQVDAFTQAVGFLLPGSYRALARAAAERDQPPPKTPFQERAEQFNSYAKKVLARAERRLTGRIHHRPLW